MKERIRDAALQAGVDDVGFAAATAYESPLSPALETLLPGARSLVVLAYRELATCESPSPQIAMNGRLDLMDFSRSCSYKVARFVERETGTRTATVPVSYPMEMSAETKGATGEVSLRHAAVAAGLGAFGRHNLVIHPRFGTRVIFTAVLTELELPADPPVTDELCTQCGKCVKQCPASALDEEGKTDLMKCLKNSQPYGIAGAIRFWTRFGEANAEGRKAMLRDPHYWRLYQAGFMGFQYFCFNCLATCPVGRNPASAYPLPGTPAESPVPAAAIARFRDEATRSRGLRRGRRSSGEGPARPRFRLPCGFRGRFEAPCGAGTRFPVRRRHDSGPVASHRVPPDKRRESGKPTVR